MKFCKARTKRSRLCRVMKAEELRASSTRGWKWNGNKVILNSLKVFRVFENDTSN
jgi:hypothetical protein